MKTRWNISALEVLPKSSPQRLLLRIGLADAAASKLNLSNPLEPPHRLKKDGAQKLRLLLNSQLPRNCQKKCCMESSRPRRPTTSISLLWFHEHSKWTPFAINGDGWNAWTLYNSVWPSQLLSLNLSFLSSVRSILVEPQPSPSLTTRHAILSKVASELVVCLVYVMKPSRTRYTPEDSLWACGWNFRTNISYTASEVGDYFVQTVLICPNTLPISVLRECDWC